MKTIAFVKSVLVLVALPLFAPTADAQVRNGGFGSRGPIKPYFTQENVDNYRKAGWKCPDAADWPQWWWTLFGPAGAVEFPRTGGVQSDSHARLAGNGVYLGGYHGLKLESDQVYTVWARGKGKLHLHVISYGRDDAGKTVQLVKPGEAAEGLHVTVNSQKWVRYRHLLVKSPPLWNVHPWVGVEQGSLDIDEVDIVPATPALALLVKAEAALYGTGALIEDKDMVKADAVFAERQKAYQESLAAYHQAKGKVDKALVESLEAELKELAPYVLTNGLTVVRVPQYNEMIAATQVLNQLAGRPAAAPAAITATEVTTTLDYALGRRDPKPEAVFVTAIEPNKILYEENEAATARVKVKNARATEQKVTLVAILHADLDLAREVQRGALTLPAGGEGKWAVSYNVGPETYGRALEIKVLDESGQEIDRWQEYYQVAKEWLRVQMHSGSRYANMGHYFANEPTDWGVQPTDAEEWISGQAGYRIIPGHRQAAIRHAQQRGTKLTFYQNLAFGGIMGYEEMRQHPEYVLYDANGQFAVDPVYGGYPNPMELASPVEGGPKRQAKKPYLDRKYTPWQHAPANWAAPGCIEYGAECIRDYAKRHGFDGIFIDGSIWVLKGYGYDGKVNLPGDKAEMARINTRVQDTYFRILKAENPNFGTWFNHSIFAVEFWRRMVPDGLYGSGLDEGESDEWIRGMHQWQNVSCLDESVGHFNKTDAPWCRPAGSFERFCRNRDYIVQKYGGNAIIGYLYHLQSTGAGPDLDKPGPAKWAWPTLNYFMAQLTATQHHVVFNTYPTPSLEPAFQFQTRYSRLLWAPDIKQVPVETVNKTLTLKSPENLWWQPLVYRRDTATGYDLIVHLVRIPPTEKWDVDWVDEPKPLADLQLTADVGKARLASALACRPYQFEEPQQTVEQTLRPDARTGKVTVAVPPFRYHTMVVFRFAKGD